MLHAGTLEAAVAAGARVQTLPEDDGGVAQVIAAFLDEDY